jgi:hypothetical protein
MMLALQRIMYPSSLFTGKLLKDPASSKTDGSAFQYWLSQKKSNTIISIALYSDNDFCDTMIL